MGAIAHAVFVHGALGFAGISGTYATVVTLTDDAIIMHVFNTLDQTIFISVDGGATDTYKVPGCTNFTIDLRASERHIKTPTIQVKDAGTPTTEGEISITVIQA